MELQCEIIRTVTEEGLAKNMKSGSLPVLATPQLIAWMEECACQALTLDEGMTSVGVEIDAHHDAPSPLGAKIRIQAKGKLVKGKVAIYEIEAWMKTIRVGWASHKRVIVNADQFMSKIA